MRDVRLARRSARRSGRPSVRLAAAALPLVLALSACGGADGGGDGGGDGADASATPTSGSAAGEAPPALTQAQLEKAAFVDGGEAAGHPVSKPALGGASFDELEYTADNKACQPLVSVAEGATDTDPAAGVTRNVELGDGLKAPSVVVQLRSYEAGGAAAIMRSLEAAGQECADGFTEDRTLAQAPVESVERTEQPESGGDGAPAIDESVSYRIRVQDVKDETIVFTEYLTVLRSGSTTLSFRLESSLDPKDHGPVPQELIDAQLQSYTEAVAG